MKSITEITAKRQETAEPIRLAAYCRVSSDSDDQKHSYAAQIRHYTEYAQKNPQYTLVDIYADEGITGTSMKKRDDFNRLMQDCRKGKIDRIVVKTISRFARNTEEFLAALRMLSSLGISVLFEEQGIDTSKLNGEMIVTLPAMAAQQESVAISENIRWSYQKRMESGEFNCCCPPYGYDMEDGNLIINESEAAIIRRIFDMYLQGYGIKAITNKLNEDMILTRRKQIKWNQSTIRYILNNEKYMGDSILQKWFTSDTLPFRRIKNAGEKPKYYVENSNPAIVSRETYQAVQALQKKRKLKSSGERKKDSHVLIGMMRCAQCGRALRRQLVDGTHYWLCTGKARGDTDCKIRRVHENEIYSAFMMMAEKLMDNRKYLITPLINQIEEMQYRTSGSQQRVKELDKEIADLGAQNLIISKLHGKGILNVAEYSAQSSEISNKISALRIERKKKLSEDEDEETLDELKTLDNILTEAEISCDFDKTLFEQIVESITVGNDTITFKLLGGIELKEKL